MHGFPIGFDYPANATILGQSGARKNPIQNTLSHAIIKACIMGELNKDGSRSFLRFERKDWGKSLYTPGSSYLPTFTDVNVLNYKRNDSLVFDAAGKCILNLYTPEDMTSSHGPNAVGGSSSLGKRKHRAKSVQEPAVHPKKRGRVVVDSDDDDDDDAPLLAKRVSKQKDAHLTDANQSMEG